MVPWCGQVSDDAVSQMLEWRGHTGTALSIVHEAGLILTCSMNSSL